MRLDTYTHTTWIPVPPRAANGQLIRVVRLRRSGGLAPLPRKCLLNFTPNPI
jgi:hypothetical protein